jgi:hypothetical protein
MMTMMITRTTMSIIVIVAVMDMIVNVITKTVGSATEETAVATARKQQRCRHRLQIVIHRR